MPRIVDHEHRRLMLATTAGVLVASDGVARATIRGVAKAAGVSTGTVSHYYRDNKELLFAAYRQAFRTSSRRFIAALDQDSSFDGFLQALFTALPFDDVSVCEWKVRMAFWGVSDYVDDVANFEHETSKQFRGLVENKLQVMRKAGAITLATSVTSAARTIEGLITGTALQCLLSPLSETASHTRKRLREQIIRGILK